MPEAHQDPDAPRAPGAHRTPEPGSDDARAALARLRHDHPDLGDRLAADHELAVALAAVLTASRALTRLVEAHPDDALATLADLDRRLPPADGGQEGLVRWRALEHLRIAARDLTGRDDLPQTGHALARMGADVLEAACRLAGASDLAVVGMGKLGGDELNYSSDVDVVLVGEGPPGDLDAQARAALEVARSCFRVDANLRPEGRNGPLVRSIASYEAYWERWAEAWEFQALLKARPVAGDAELGRRWLDAAQRHLWGRPFSAEDLRAVRAMKQRTEAGVARRGLADRELKTGPGGIRDIEFTVQILQLVHGSSDPDLRTAGTLPTLAELAEAGYVDPADAARLAEAYRFFRLVEHRLQLVEEQQVHALPTAPAALDHLARVLGFRDLPKGSAASQLLAEVRGQQHAVRAIHQRVYFRPLLEAFAEHDGALSPEAAVERLAAFGFTDALRTQAAVRELTRGLNRSSRLMQQLLPLVLDWLSATPDPDLGLLLLRNLLGDPTRNRLLVATFRESAESAHRLCTLLGTSRLLGDVVLRNPELVARLPHPEQLRTRPRDELVASATAAVAWREESARQEALHRWKDRNLLGIGARDVLGEDTVDVVGHDLATLAEATLDAALALVDPQIPFAVIAMGRFGGAELSYASDLDVLLAYDGSGADAAEEANRVASRLVRLVHGATPAARIFEVDADLRPEGKQGPLARSLTGFGAYWDGYAQTWERLAMVRARAVAGDRELGRRLLDELAPRVWGDGLTHGEVVELRRMKARIENERIPPGEDPDFHLKLGRGSLSDVEFTAQLLQLRHGVRATGTMAALAALVDDGVLEREDAELLEASYRFCEQVRNRWYLVGSGPSDALPTQSEALTWLARSLDTDAGSLREHYRRVTRRARRVVERVFYGQG
jgi:glutamate-ammonia-ligase adenylyltransferase